MENPVLLKSAIIGKVWANGEKDSIIPGSFTLPMDMNFGKNESYLIGGLTMRTDRHLNASLTEDAEEPVSVKASEKLFFYANPKRTENDPDYSVSVLLPVAVAEAVIKNNKKGQAAWRAEHQAETV
jgi:hypothetical protein